MTPWGSEIRRVLNSLALRSMVVPWTGPFRIATYVAQETSAISDRCRATKREAQDSANSLMKIKHFYSRRDVLLVTCTPRRDAQ